MKKNIFNLLVLYLLVGCSSNPEDFPQLDKDSYKIDIRATVQTSSLVKSGPINGDFSTDFPIGIYAYSNSWQEGATANVINNDQATVLGAAGHSVIFSDGPYYYPKDGSKIYFFAFAPRATGATSAEREKSPVVTINMTGQEDVIWATSTGQKSWNDAAVHPVLNFQHKLTQLQFVFKSESPHSAAENTVISLTVNNQPNLATMIVESGECTFNGSINMQALSKENQNNGITITDKGTDANSPVMTNIAPAYTLTVIVKPANGGDNVTYTDVPINLTTAVGKAHVITLNFTAIDVSPTATATVADWLTGTDATVDVL